MKKIKDFIFQFISSIFGQINYNKPNWMNVISEKIKSSSYNNKKNQFILLGLCATAISIYIAKLYYDSLPKPEAVTFNLYSPSFYNVTKPEVRSIQINFSKSVAPANMIGKEILEGIELTPKIKGKWYWQSDRELKFTPVLDGKIDWPVGVKYKGYLTKKVIADHINLKTDEFSFQIDNIKASLYGQSFYQDPRFSDTKKVLANFTFNYPVDVEGLKKRIKLTEKTENGFEKASEAELQISFNEDKTMVFLSSSNIQVNESNREFKFILEKGYASIFGGESQEDVSTSVKVPSLYDYFKFTGSSIVIARNEKYESEQILRLENKAEIASEELAKSVEIYELPFHLDDSDKKKNPYQWSSVSEVTADILKKSKKIKMDLIPTEEMISLQHSFRLNLTPGRAIYVKVPKNTTSFGGFKLKDDYEAVHVVPEYPADLQFMGKGALIPLTGSKNLSLVSRNLNKISYVVNQIRLEHINHLIPALMYDYVKPETYDLRAERISERFDGEIPLINKNPQKTQFSSIDLNQFLNNNKKGLFFITINSKDSQQYVNDRRFILVTDLGMIVKKSVSGSYDIFVQNISTGLPAAGVKVSVLGQNGITVLSTETNSNGSCSFPNLKDFKNDKLPIAFLAQYGENISFVPYNAYSREIDLSQFDIGGVRDSSESDQLNAFIFSDRGIYRPGENVDFGLIVRSKNWNKSFQKIPVEITIENPSAQQVYKKTVLVSSNSIDSIAFKTEDFYQTGQYNIYAHIHQNDRLNVLIGSSSFQVEEFVPDQIKVRTALNQSEVEGWVKPNNLKLNLTAFNLYGKAATDRLAKAKIKIKPTDIFFKKWKEYNFNTQIGSSQLEINDSLPDMKTNDNGELEWNLNVTQLESSAYRMYVNSEVFETDGGRSVKAQLSQLISDRDFLLGINILNNDMSFLKKDVKSQIEIITVNSKLDLIPIKNITVEVVEKKPTSVLTKLPNETYAYQTVYKTSILKTFIIETSAKPFQLKLDTDKIGEFSLVLKDENKVVLNSVTYNVVGQADIERGLDKSTTLKLGLNKKDYQPNEQIEIQIKSPYAGAGLITIERDKVYALKWFKSSTTSTVQTIQIPAGLEGQAYIVVTMLRDIKADDIYTSPLSYGVATFAIDLDARKANIEIKAPSVVKPGENLNFKVKMQSKTKAAIYLVDEGILQVANYKTPAPLNYFFQKKALQVSTSQILDLVMPDFAQILPSASGGDEAALLGNSINPFKRKNIAPVAKWLGVFDLSEKWTDLQYLVPDHFNGNIKIMIVAADDKKLGSQSIDVNVRGDFIINATSTTFTSPGDEFEVNLIIANQLKASGEKAKVNVIVDPSKDGYIVLGEKELIVDIPENKEKNVNFKFKAPTKLDEYSIEIKAGINKNQSKVRLYFSNRPAVPYQQKIQWSLVNNKEINLNVENNNREEFKKNTLYLHTSIQDLVKPFEEFYTLNDYLCSEQIASKLTPLVLKPNKSKEDDKLIDKLISLLRARQKSDGSFGLYPNSYESNLDVSLHLGMIFLYMQEKGEPVPNDIWKRYLSSLKTGYSQAQTKLDLQRKAKAIYILVKSQIIPKDDLRNIAQLIKDKKTHKDITSLAATYLAASFKAAMQDDLTYKTLSIAQTNLTNPRSFEYIFPESDEYERQSILLKNFPEKAENQIASSEFLKIIEVANQQKINTYSTSYYLMALDALLKNNIQNSTLEKISISSIDKSGLSKTLSHSASMNLPPDAQKLKIINSTGKPFLISYVNSGFDQTDEMKQSYSGIEISRSIVDEENREIKSVEIGQEAIVKIRARVLDKTMTSIIINDLLPAGFEVVLNSVRNNLIENQNMNHEVNEGTEGESGEVDAEPNEDVEVNSDGAYNWPFKFILNQAYAQVVSSNVAPMFTDHVDVREDRINIYTSLDDNLKEYTYKIKAITKGKFKLPGVYAKGLYRTDLVGQSASGYIEVK